MTTALIVLGVALYAVCGTLVLGYSKGFYPKNFQDEDEGFDAALFCFAFWPAALIGIVSHRISMGVARREKLRRLADAQADAALKELTGEK